MTEPTDQLGAAEDVFPPPESSRRSSMLVAAGILLSRVAGLVREIVISGYLGVGVAADAFKAALRIPNLLQNLLGEGVLSASFIPVYARLLEQRDEREAGRLAGAIAGLLTAVTGVLVLVGVALARPIAVAITPGFSGEALDLTVDLLRVMFPGIGFLVLSAWCLGILNSHRRFFLSYVAPVMWNAAQIAAVVAVGVGGATQRNLAEALAWGVLIGGILQFAIQLPTVLQVSRGVAFRLDTADARVRDVIGRFGPVVFGRGVVQIAGYLDLVLASFLAVGAVSALTYGQVLYLLPISLFGMSVAAAELPELARLDLRSPAARGRMRERLDEGLGRIAFYVAPTAVIYLVVGDVIVRTLLQRGEFESDDTTLVWLVVAAYAVGLVATTSSRLLQNALYALDDPRTPARIAAVRVAVAAILGVALMFQLDRIAIGDGLRLVEDLPAFGPLPEGVRRAADGAVRLGAVGLALASGVAAWLEYTLLRLALRWRIGTIEAGGGWLGPLAAASTACAIVAFLAEAAFGGMPSLLAAVLVAVPALLAYLGVSARLGVPEAEAWTRRLRGAAR